MMERVIQSRVEIYECLNDIKISKAQVGFVKGEEEEVCGLNPKEKFIKRYPRGSKIPYIKFISKFIIIANNHKANNNII